MKHVDAYSRLILLCAPAQGKLDGAALFCVRPPRGTDQRVEKWTQLLG